MSIDGIAMQAAPRRTMHAGSNGERFLLSPYVAVEDYKLRFGGSWAQPRTIQHELRTRAFKEAVNKAAGSDIRVAQLRTPPYELCISAKNLATGREVRLYASFFADLPVYSASLQRVDGESSQFVRALRANNPKKLEAQFKQLKKRLYRHLVST